MTGQEYISAIQDLIRAGRFEEARTVATQHRAQVFPLLTADEFVYIMDILEMVDRVAEASQARSPSIGMAGPRP